MKVSVSVSGDKELQDLLAQMPKLVVATGGPIDNAVSKASTVVARRARSLAPDSRKSQSREKQSKKSKRIWNRKLRTTIRSVVRKYPTTAVGIIGPKSPEGNAAHFMQEKGRRLVLWGKTTNIALYRIAKNWITQAFDETKGEQHSAMMNSLKTDMDKVMRGRS